MCRTTPGRRNGPARPGRVRRAPTACWLSAALLAACCGCDQMEEPPRPAPPPTTTYPVPAIRVLLTGPDDPEARIATTGGYRLEADGRAIAESDRALGPVAVRREAGGWRIGSGQAEGRELRLRPHEGSHFRLNETTYRGWLRLLPGEGEGLEAVNHVDIEEYLAGVLAKELYRTWHIEAYRALAVAARTFALYQMATFGPAHEYDLGDSQASQVYGGLDGETSTSRQAVDDTRGVVLSCGEPGRERIFLAQYSACCGGRVNGAYVIRNANRIEPLMGGQECTDCSGCSRYRWPTVRVAKRDIHRALLRRYTAAAGLGGVSRIDVATETPHGRAVWTDVIGPTGQKLRVRAEDIRLSLLYAGVPAAKGLNSMNCRLVDRGGSIEFADGRGFGHGVGLCQWGAQAKAQRGLTAEGILAFYYPGARLYRVH